MTPLDYLDRLTVFSSFLSSILVCGFAVQGYRNTKKRSLLFIAIACGLTAMVEVLGFIGRPSWFRWTICTVSIYAGAVLWVVGSWILIRDYVQMLGREAKPSPLPDTSPE